MKQQQQKKSDNNNITSLQTPVLDVNGDPMLDESGKVMYRQVTNPMEIQQLVEEVTKEQQKDKARRAILEQNKEKSGLSSAKNGYRSCTVNDIKDPVTGQIHHITTFYINGLEVSEREYFANTKCNYCNYALKGKDELLKHLSSVHNMQNLGYDNDDKNTNNDNNDIR